MAYIPSDSEEEETQPEPVPVVQQVKHIKK